MRSIIHQPTHRERSIKLAELDWQDGDEQAVKADLWQSDAAQRQHPLEKTSH
jgi:hypothetical protein